SNLTLENVDNTIQGTGNLGDYGPYIVNEAGGTILANATGLTNNAVNTPLTIGVGYYGFVNNGTIHVVTASFGNPATPAGNTLVLDLSQPSGALANFTNNGTVTVDDGSTLEVLGGGEINNNGAINVGSSTGATMQLNGNRGYFFIDSRNTAGTLTLAGGSTLTGVAGTESLTNGLGSGYPLSTIQGNGSITNLSLDNRGNIIANNGLLEIAPNSSGITNDNYTGTMQVTSGNTLELDLSKTSYATGSTPPPGTNGLENLNTVTVADGGTLEFSDTTPSSTVLIDNVGSMNVGSSTGGTVLLSDGGHGATFDFSGDPGGGLTLVNSTIKGVSGDESLLNDANIIGTGTITHLAALTNTNNGGLGASGGTLDLSTINLTNLSGGVLTDGSYYLLNNGAQQNATLKLPGDVNTLNGAYLQLSATNYKVLDSTGGNAIANLNTLENGGYLEVDGGVTFNSANNFTVGKPTDTTVSTLRADGGAVNIGSPTTGANLNNATGFVAVVSGGVMNVYGDLTNTDGRVYTGYIGGDPGGNALNVTGNFINNHAGSGPSTADFELLANNDSATVGGNFSNNGTVGLVQGASLAVHGSTGFTQTGGATIVLGTLTASSVNINGGQLMGTGTIVGNVTNGGTTAGGAIPPLYSTAVPGTLSITGSYTQTSGGTLDDLISGTAAGQFSVINATGSMTLAGALDVSTLNGFAFANGKSFDILNFTGRSGEFGTFTYGSYSGSGSSPLNIGCGLQLELAYNNNDVLLNVGQMNTSNTDNWIDATDNWNNSANYATDWSTGAIPTSSQDVVVDTGAGGTVTYNDANDTVKSLTVQKGTSSNYTLAFDANDKLTVTNAVDINQGGEIDVAASGASISASSLANNAGTLKVANGGSVSTTGDLSNSNSGVVTASSGGTVDVSGTLTNDGTSTVEAQNGGTITTSSYDNSGNTKVDSGGTLTTTNLYDQTGSAASTDVAGTMTTYAYDMGGGTTHVESSGTLNVTSGTPNSNNLYDQTGGTTTVDGKLTTYNYDDAGNTVVNTDGTLNATNSYDQTSNAASIDILGAVTTTTYDALGKTTVEADPQASVTTTLYDQTGNVAATTDSGTITTTTYDMAGGTTTVKPGGKLDATSSYNQSAGTTDVDGTLITPSYGLTGGTLTGTGTVQGNVSNTGGTVDPGDEPNTGTLTITGHYSQGSNGMLMADINGGTAGGATNGWDVLDIGGTASLGGTLDISLNNGFLPTDGEMFQILDATGGLGGTTFASIMNDTFGANGSWDVIYGTDTVTLEAAYTQSSATPEPASLLLLGTGLLGLAWVVRRKKATSSSR
ncbi:MAG: beta strand repeat-containing protein, partial [Terriglobia bacterium]